MKFQIKNRFDLSIIFECETDSMRLAVELAVSKKISLYGADLSEADLSRADLSQANLYQADLSQADLSEANLSGADLSRANLSQAYLSQANLYQANLSQANLSGADLSGAYLYGANLSGAYLSRADLTEIKKDFFQRLSLAKNEAIGLYKAHIEGRVDGSIYDGECGCFCGTIANVLGIKSDQLYDKIGLNKDSQSPTEKWYLAIQKGHAVGQPVVDITLNWIREWAKENNITLPANRIVWE